MTQNEPFTIVSVAPNPAQDLVKIVLNKSGYGRLNISLTDITGKQVADYSQNIQEGTFQLELNTSTLSSGIYVLHMVTNGVAKTEKIVINK